MEALFFISRIDDTKGYLLDDYFGLNMFENIKPKTIRYHQVVTAVSRHQVLSLIKAAINNVSIEVMVAYRTSNTDKFKLYSIEELHTVLEAQS